MILKAGFHKCNFCKRLLTVNSTNPGGGCTAECRKASEGVAVKWNTNTGTVMSINSNGWVRMRMTEKVSVYAAYEVFPV